MGTRAARSRPAFEKECGCTLDWVAVTDGVAMLNRLKLEGSGTKADVVLGLDTNLAAEAKARSLRPARPGCDKAHASHRLDRRHIPSLRLCAFRRRLRHPGDAEGPPRASRIWSKARPDEKIVLEDPRTSTPGLGFLLWMKAVYGDEAARRLEEAKAAHPHHHARLDRSLRSLHQGRGAHGAKSYTTSPAYHMIAEKTERYQALKFSKATISRSRSPA